MLVIFYLSFLSLCVTTPRKPHISTAFLNLTVQLDRLVNCPLFFLVPYTPSCTIISSTSCIKSFVVQSFPFDFPPLRYCQVSTIPPANRHDAKFGSLLWVESSHLVGVYIVPMNLITQNPIHCTVYCISH